MEILSCSLLVCRAWSAQWRSVGAVAPERVVASFLCSRLVSCTCALLWMFILTHATALKPFHSKQSYPLHHLQHFTITSPLKLVNQIWWGWPRNQTSARAGAVQFEGWCARKSRRPRQFSGLCLRVVASSQGLYHGGKNKYMQVFPLGK